MSVHLREACLLFASAITKSLLYVRQNDKMHAHQITLLSFFSYNNMYVYVHTFLIRMRVLVICDRNSNGKNFGAGW